MVNYSKKEEKVIEKIVKTIEKFEKELSVKWEIFS